MLTKLFLNFEQFEQFLKIVALAKPQSISRSQKVSSLFETLSSALRIQLEFNKVFTSVKRSNSIYSVNSELNESNSSLDMSIKEALDTLKSETKKQIVNPGRITISPRPVGRVYSSPSTPRRSYRANADSSKIRVSLLAPSQSYKQIVRIKGKCAADLDEFLEAERQVQKEVARPVLKNRDLLKKTTENGKRVQTWHREEPKLIQKEKILEQTVASLNTLVKKCKGFIQKVQNSKVHKFLILKLSFKVWALSSIKLNRNLT